MLLEIVWRNPIPVTMIENSVRRVTSDGCGAVYAVQNQELTERFELITCSQCTN